MANSDAIGELRRLVFVLKAMGELGMALTTSREEIEQALARLEREPVPEEVAELSRRLDALVGAVEILARDQYNFPGLPDSRLRSALARARRR